jgi:hypothetical protein
VRPGQVKKINIAIPDFTLVGGTDPQNWANRLPGITTVDLNFTSLFSVVSGTPPLPPGGAEAVRPRLAEFAAAGAMHALQGLLTVRNDRFEVEMRLYDLTSQDFRIIGTKKVVGARLRAAPGRPSGGRRGGAARYRRGGGGGHQDCFREHALRSQGALPHGL